MTRVSSLPPTRRLTTGDLGRKTTVAAAERRLGFAILEPRERPDAVYLLSRPGSKRLTLVYGSVRRPRLLLSEFRGTGTTTYIQKFVEPGTKVERVRIGDAPGIWIGGPHAVLYAAPGTGGVLYSDDPILAGSTLVWERPGGLTLRLEGTLTKAGAERLAGSLREPPGKGTSAGR